MQPQPYEEMPEDQLLALCEWREADSVGELGMRGVGHVAANREKVPGWWGVDLRSILLKPWQFSCFNEGDPDEKRWPDDDNPQWIAAQEIAKAIIAGDDLDLTSGATSYYDVSITPPDWTQELIFTTQIGSLRFYRRRT